MSLAESVRQRLLNLSKSQNETFDLMLTLFGMERLLYRLSRSQWKNEFVLKGAILFRIWDGSPHRPTRDLDLMGFINNDVEGMRRIFQSICQTEVENDGIVFLPESVQCDEIREGNLYQGIRVRLIAELAGARIRLQVDVGFGDTVIPEPVNIVFPTLLELPAPRLLAYSRYSVVSEKFHALVILGIINSRMKDFYDLWLLIQKFDFSGSILNKAIHSTFRRRHTEIPREVPLALTDSFSSDEYKTTQWNAFLKKNNLESEAEDLTTTIQILHDFLMPPVLSLAHNKPFTQSWSPPGPWSNNENVD